MARTHGMPMSKEIISLEHGNALFLKKCEPFLFYFSRWVWYNYFPSESPAKLDSIYDLGMLIKLGLSKRGNYEKQNDIMNMILYDMETCHDALLTLGDISHIKSNRLALFTISYIANCVHGFPSAMIQLGNPKTLLTILNNALLLEETQGYTQAPLDLLFQRGFIEDGLVLRNKNSMPLSLPPPSTFVRMKRVWLGRVYLWWQEKNIRELKWLPLDTTDHDMTRDVWDLLKSIHQGSQPEFQAIDINHNVHVLSEGILRKNTFFDTLTVACGERYQFAIYAYLALIKKELERHAIKNLLAKMVANRKNKMKKRVSTRVTHP